MPTPIPCKPAGRAVSAPSNDDTADRAPRVCFVGLQNLPVLSTAHAAHGIGGEQVQQTLLARAFVRRGFDVSMVVADYGQPDRLVLEGITLFKAYGLDAGLPVLRFVHPRFTRLWAALRRADADAYYVSIAGPQLGIAALFTLLHARRLVFRIASDADCDPQRSLIRFARDRWLYAFGLRRAHVLLAQTAHQVRAMQANYKLPSRLASMLVEPAAPPRPFEQRAVDVLWVGNMLPLKRPQWILDIARRLPQLRFHVVGGAQPGHQALWDAIAADAARLPNVEFHGRLPYREANALFDRARVFVNTSEIEGFPNGFLQAWQRGVPVVTCFDPDRIVARCGLGASVASVDDMVREVGRLAGSPADWQAASGRCLRYMADHHGEGMVLSAYIQSLAPSLHPGAALSRTEGGMPS